MVDSQHYPHTSDTVSEMFEELHANGPPVSKYLTIRLSASPMAQGKPLFNAPMITNPSLSLPASKTITCPSLISREIKQAEPIGLRRAGRSIKLQGMTQRRRRNSNTRPWIWIWIWDIDDKASAIHRRPSASAPNRVDQPIPLSVRAIPPFPYHLHPSIHPSIHLSGAKPPNQKPDAGSRKESKPLSQPHRNAIP